MHAGTVDRTVSPGSLAARLGAAALLLLLAGAPSGCSSELTQDESCAAYVTSVCGFLNRCNTVYFTSAYGDISVCISRYKLQCGNIFAPGVSTTPSDLKACGDSLASLACGSIDLPDSCRAKPGAVKTGGACYTDSQCQGTYCQPSLTSGNGCGTCSSRAAVGASCSNASCDYGLACASQAGGPLVCATPTSAALGETCGGSAICQSGLICLGKKCVTPLKLGDACGTAGTICDPVSGLTCDSTSMKCTATPFAKVGQTCGTTGPQTQCAASGRCVQQGAGYVCVAPAADGAACDLSKGLGCQDPATCVSGVCTVPQASACM
jgi:hypothetical protein